MQYLFCMQRRIFIFVSAGGLTNVRMRDEQNYNIQFIVLYTYTCIRYDLEDSSGRVFFLQIKSTMSLLLLLLLLLSLLLPITFKYVN